MFKQSKERIKGKILWFDTLTGEGMIKAENGDNLYLHFTEIKGIDSNNLDWPADKDRDYLERIRGKNCTFIVDNDFNAAEKVIVL